MDDDTPITWGRLKRAIENAERTAGAYSESADPHVDIAQSTAAMTLAHLEAALDEERKSAELAEAVAKSRET